MVLAILCCHWNGDAIGFVADFVVEVVRILEFRHDFSDEGLLHFEQFGVRQAVFPINGRQVRAIDVVSGR